MKKILYIICAIFALTACNKEELPTVGGQNHDGSYTFNIGIEEPDYVVGSASKTRATVTMTRYLLEMYEGSLSATPVKMESTDGVFNVDLKKGVDYVCLFWADGGAAAYDATSLKAVKQSDETKTGTAAYCASVTVNSKTFNGAVTLKRAVAELLFIDKNGLTEAINSLKITYPYASATLNVGDGAVTYAAGTAVRTITGITPPAQATDAFTTDFILAPKEAGKLTGLKFQLNSEAEKTIAETAVQANFRTKITGVYCKEVLKVGSYYYDDKTFSTKYDTKGGMRTCIGIVFVVNADGTTGKIVGLTQGRNLAWSTKNVATGATDVNNGRTNMATIAAFITNPTNSTSWDEYPAFKWVAQQNGKTDGGWDAVNDKWYLPAKEELKALYGKYNGDTNVDDKVKVAVNASLDAIGATQIAATNSWASTENTSTTSWYVLFSTSATDYTNKTYTRSVRCVREF